MPIIFIISLEPSRSNRPRWMNWQKWMMRFPPDRSEESLSSSFALRSNLTAQPPIECLIIASAEDWAVFVLILKILAKMPLFITNRRVFNEHATLFFRPKWVQGPFSILLKHTRNYFRPLALQNIMSWYFCSFSRGHIHSHAKVSLEETRKVNWVPLRKYARGYLPSPPPFP